MSRTYVPLWCKSHFSRLEGASSPAEFVQQAKLLGLDALALTDRDSVAGAPRAAAAARQVGIHLIYGAELTLVGGRRATILAKDRAGYGRLTQLISQSHLKSAKGKPQLEPAVLAQAAPGCIALLGGDDGWVGASPDLRWPEVNVIKEAFGEDLWLRVSDHGCPEERGRQQLIERRARRLGVPIVAANELLYHAPEQRQLQDALTCVRHGTTLEEAGRLLRRNDQHALEAHEGFARRFRGRPAWVEASAQIASRCRFSLFDLRYRYPCEQLPQGMSGMAHLTQLAREGARARYRQGVPQSVQHQLARELALVGELEYEGYFLTMWEIVRFCSRQGILCQGRGSAANSVLCFCLGITAVDPLKHDLLFERFLSRERREPPDIDLDIAHERREEVLQYVYQKYGRRYAAMVSVNIRYRIKSALRDSGKILNIPQKNIDALSKMAGGSRGSVSADVLIDAGLSPDDSQVTRWVQLALKLLDTPRHTSIHPGGFLLGHEPVDTLVPIEPGAMSGRTVIQWDKEDVETLGLFKVDLLGLGMLSQLQRCFAALRRHPLPKANAFLAPCDADSLARIPADDEATYTMLCKGASLGVFQIESRAQMNMLPRLKPRCFYDVVVQIALVRPGPISGAMVHPYLRRRHGLEPVVYPHASLEPVLRRTMGVPLFQEQVMRIAMVAADYSPGEADQLRRDMAAWKRQGNMAHHEEKLVGRMVAKGIDECFAQRVYDQIKGFGAYGFPESHAASFALISYATAYLKCHAPSHFYAALLNAQPMGFYSVSTLVYGAQREGVCVRPVDLRFSLWDCTLEAHEAGYALRMGLRFIKGLGSSQRHVFERVGPPQAGEELPHYARRLGVDRGALEALAEAGAFRCYGDRRAVLWCLSEPGLSRHEPLILPELPIALPELKPSECIAWDQRRSGHSTGGHPLALLRSHCDEQGYTSAQGMACAPDKSRVRCIGLVVCRQRPSTASGVVFVTLEDETGFINLVVWPQVALRFRALLRGVSVLAVGGRLQREEGVVHLIAHRFWVPELSAGIEPVLSHDYR